MTMPLAVLAEPWPSLLSRLEELGRGAGRFGIDLTAAVVVMLLGWGLAALAARVARVVLRAARFNAAVARVRGHGAPARHEPARVAAWAVYWLVLAGAAMVSLETLGLSLAVSVANRLAEVVPRILTSAVIFSVGALLALLAGGITRRFLDSAGIRGALFQGQVMTGVLTGFAALLALEQLGFAAQFVMAVGIVAVAAAGLGLALAFGLGCRDLARDFLVEYLRSLDGEGTQRPD